jgi:rhodanese-related sulfurtransferase
MLLLPRETGKRIITFLLLSAVFLSVPKDVCALLYQDISVLELRQRMEDETDCGYIILDVRPSADYEEGHIQDAINIPLKELGYRLFILDRTKDIIVYCNFGLQSKVACQVLTNSGFKDVYNLTDGLTAWNYGLETDYRTASI